MDLNLPSNTTFKEVQEEMQKMKDPLYSEPLTEELLSAPALETMNANLDTSHALEEWKKEMRA